MELRLSKVGLHYMFASASLIFALVSSSCCYASDLVFIRSDHSVSDDQKEIEAAAAFYGLNLKVVKVTSRGDDLAIRRTVEDKETVGVAIEANALATVSKRSLFRALNRRAISNIPLFILGVQRDLSLALLKGWSGGEATRCAPIESSSKSRYVFDRVQGVTWQLANLEIPLSNKKTLYLAFEDNRMAQRIESIRGGGETFPVFIESTIGQQAVFLACAVPEGGNVSDNQDLVSAFLRIAPAMMFVRYSAGERSWHALHHYANFTIDDPWLREPYGHVNYEGLLGEMDKHHFHTTIAFIPWNYKRSQPEVVSLFRNHSDLFSIAIHGNDHDHKEFTDYGEKSLADQVGGLRQALARMERFQRLTGIPYDKVMIFPHSIAPEQTLGALKTYNFLATVNSSNVPQNATRPADLSEILRPVTLSFEGFPSISRYSTEMKISEAYIAINQFLDNPLFFYAHSDFFSKGISAFDQVADEVNKLEPATEWRSLGDIARHLYVVKLRDDSNYDVQAFSNDICLENTTSQSSTFYVQKREIGDQTIDAVTVDGLAQPYSIQQDRISLILTIPLRGSRCIAIRYANNLKSSPINASHGSIVVYMLRMGSDFRDIYLAKSGFGLAFIRFYNVHRLKPVEVVGCLFLFLVALTSTCRLLWLFAKRRLSSNPTIPHCLKN
ncbi:hypothetical protein [Tunturiibacter psychrotolerans]|uniref:hypothetical protein n=1 Tax=Tunturiibacter psychrotolerans TaxID=3069686 RepID=UPI003D24C435